MSKSERGKLFFINNPSQLLLAIDNHLKPDNQSLTDRQRFILVVSNLRIVLDGISPDIGYKIIDKTIDKTTTDGQLILFRGTKDDISMTKIYDRKHDLTYWKQGEVSAVTYRDPQIRIMINQSNRSLSVQCDDYETSTKVEKEEDFQGVLTTMTPLIARVSQALQVKEA